MNSYVVEEKGKSWRKMQGKKRYVIELEGEMIRFKEKIQIMEEKFRAKEMTWTSDYQAFVAIIKELKAEGMHHYMEHFDYWCSLFFPVNLLELHERNGATAIDNRW